MFSKQTMEKLKEFRKIKSDLEKSCKHKAVYKKDYDFKNKDMRAFENFCDAIRVVKNG